MEFLQVFYFTRCHKKKTKQKKPEKWWTPSSPGSPSVTDLHAYTCVCMCTHCMKQDALWKTLTPLSNCCPAFHSHRRQNWSFCLAYGATNTNRYDMELTFPLTRFLMGQIKKVLRHWQGLQIRCESNKITIPFQFWIDSFPTPCSYGRGGGRHMAISYG